MENDKFVLYFSETDKKIMLPVGLEIRLLMIFTQLTGNLEVVICKIGWGWDGKQKTDCDMVFQNVFPMLII